MGGGLLQLVAYGAQDAYITGNPQITFWKGLYKRHTNFAMEPFRVNFSGQSQWGTKQTAIIGRHADLLYSTYIEVVLPKDGPTGYSDFLWNNDQGALGFNLIKYVELDIGGQIIDRLYGEWLYLWSALTSNSTTLEKTKNLVSGPCDSIGASSLSNGVGCGTSGRQVKPNVLYIPLSFFYTKNPGAALPLIALQYHEVKINIYWNENQTIAGNYTQASKVPPAVQAAIYIDYIYLDTEERRRMAQGSHEYLIEQTQYNEDKGIVSANNRIDLTFNHPVKELVWVVQPSYYKDCSLMAGVAGPKTYYNVLAVPAFYSGNYSGTGLRLDVVSNGNSYTVINVSDGGSGFSTTSQSNLGIKGSLLGGVDGTNNDILINCTFTSSTVTNTDLTLINNNLIGYPAQQYTRLMPLTYDVDPVYEQWLQINGQDRMDRRYSDYFNRVQSFQHHTGSLSASPATAGVFSYSFALKPEENQPSGTCNFSRIDTATIVMNLGDTLINDSPDYQNWDVRVYAVNYNILRVMSGMAGLAYSN